MYTLKEISERLNTQDNACTAWPMFTVQKRRRIYGMDMDHADGSVWLYVEDSIEADEEQAKAFDDDEWGEENPSDWQEYGYIDVWEIEQVFFTMAAAESYQTSQAHNLGVSRITVESFHRNHEMIAIRDYLLSLKD